LGNQGVKYDYNEEIKVRTGSHKKKFLVDIDEEDADIVVERPASIEDPKVYVFFRCKLKEVVKNYLGVCLIRFRLILKIVKQFNCY
jgi:hypothetical protein